MHPDAARSLINHRIASIRATLPKGHPLADVIPESRKEDDLPNEVSTMEMTAAIWSTKVDEIRALQAALARVEEGTYGHCGCGKQIAVARLKALPQARLCIECARMRGTPVISLHSTSSGTMPPIHAKRGKH